MAVDVIEPDSVPVLVAASQMQWYQVFGHLFAAFGSDVFRLDRHPVMARHPVTPMTESDVAKHISAQSRRVKASYLPLHEPVTLPQQTLATSKNKISVYTLDCIDENSESAAGKFLWDYRLRN